LAIGNEKAKIRHHAPGQVSMAIGCLQQKAFGIVNKHAF